MKRERIIVIKNPKLRKIRILKINLKLKIKKKWLRKKAYGMIILIPS